jgi:hypothetical protein
MKNGSCLENTTAAKKKQLRIRSNKLMKKAKKISCKKKIKEKKKLK